MFVAGEVRVGQLSLCSLLCVWWWGGGFHTSTSLPPGGKGLRYISSDAGCLRAGAPRPLTAGALPSSKRQSAFLRGPPTHATHNRDTGAESWGAAPH